MRDRYPPSFATHIFLHSKTRTIQIKSNQIFSAKINLHTLTANVDEKRVTKILGIVMVGFAFCWPPVCIIAAALRVPTLPRQVHFTYGFLVYLSSAYQPPTYMVELTGVSGERVKLF